MGLKPKLLYIVKFCPKNQLCDNKADRHFYNKEKADNLVDRYRADEYHCAVLHTIQPED